MARLISAARLGAVGVLVVCASPGYASRLQLPPFAHCLHQAGGSIAVEACDPVALANAYLNHTLTDRGPLLITVRDPHERTPHRSGSNPGMVQVVGLPLTSGARMYFLGQATRRMDVNIAAMQVGSNGRPRRLISILVAPKDVKVSGPRAMWQIDWPSQSRLPILRERSPQRRVIPFRVLGSR